MEMCFCCFFVKIIFLTACLTIAVAGARSQDNLGGVLYKTEDKENLEIKSYNISNVYYNSCTYNNGKDPNIRKNIEAIIKVLVKDSLPLAMENLDAQEHDIARDIQVAANKIIIQLALHASNITRKILQSMEKLNDSQVVIDTEVHNELIVYQNQIEKIEELENKISLLSNKTKELTDTINVTNNHQSESMASMNNKMATLENLTSSDIHDIRNMIATIEKTQKSFMNYSELQTNQKEENVTKVTSLCDFKVPASIIPNPNIWKIGQIPEQDDLDTYMINKTGCSYRAVGFGDEHSLAAGAFPGQLEWRVAVRARMSTFLRLCWDRDVKYALCVGYEFNTMSQLFDYVHYQHPERATPGVLAEDRYVPFYIRIKNGTLTAGAECDPEPWFTADCPAEKGIQIQTILYPASTFGAKSLYNCPASFTGE